LLVDGLSQWFDTSNHEVYEYRFIVYDLSSLSYELIVTVIL